MYDIKIPTVLKLLVSVSLKICRTMHTNVLRSSEPTNRSIIIRNCLAFNSLQLPIIKTKIKNGIYYVTFIDGGTEYNPLSHKDLSDYILSSTGDIYKDGQLRLIIETTDTEPSVVGCIDLYDFDIRNLRAGISIYILDEYRNQGFALEAIELLKTYASEFLHIRILFAIVSADNSYSVSLFKKSGFSVSAQLADWFCDSDAVLFTKTFS